MGRSRQDRAARTARTLRWLAISAGALASVSALAACGGASAGTTSGGSGGGGTYHDHPLQRPASRAHPGARQRVREADRHQREGPHRRRHRAGRPDPAGGLALARRRLPHRELPRADAAHRAQRCWRSCPRRSLSQVPAAYDSPTGNWVGMSVRVSALAYDPALVPASQLPASILDLAQPQWKGKVAIAPTDSDFVPLVGAVIATYGHAGGPELAARPQGQRRPSTPTSRRWSRR